MAKLSNLNKVSIAYWIEIRYLSPYEKGRFIALFEKYRALITHYDTSFEGDRFGKEWGYFMVFFKDEGNVIPQSEINFISRQP